MNGEIINQIRFELRSLLFKEVDKQSIITIEVIPGQLAMDYDDYNPEKAEYETFIQVNGFDRAISRGTEGFGGGTPTAGASHGDSPSLEKTDEELGAWKVLGLPDRTATGMGQPSPWIVFMDWFWDFLKKANLSPTPAKGFGPKVCSKKTCPAFINHEQCNVYSHLSPTQKRQRKYGVPHKSSDVPEAQLRPARVGPQSAIKTRALEGPEHLWPAGFHIKRFITIAISSLGTDPHLIANKFRGLISKAKTDPWFEIVDNQGILYVTANVEQEMPEGWRERLGATHLAKVTRRAEWGDLLRDFSERRTNVAQLNPILARYMVDKEKFQHPFSIDILNPDEYKRAKQVLEQLKLETLVAYAKEIGISPPVVGQMARGGKTPKTTQYDRMWDNAVEKLAAMGPIDRYVVDEAVSKWMSEKGGFEDPFDFDLLQTDKEKLKALIRVSRLTLHDLSGMVESVQKQIKALLG